MLKNNGLTESVRLLSEENTQLKEKIEVLRDVSYNSELNLQIMTDLTAQLKEALRKCSPYIIEIEYGEIESKICAFCETNWYSSSKEHTDDCEYVQLTKESEGL
jgi:hypothetical protein